jgi:uncharacterized repeat protein (TIGR02543 family)
MRKHKLSSTNRRLLGGILTLAMILPLAPVSASDYIAQGGDGYTMLVEPFMNPGPFAPPIASSVLPDAAAYSREEAEWTIGVYLCGTDLESGGGAATSDLLEMLAADIPDYVNVIVLTGGTKNWNPNELAADGYIEPSGDFTQLWRVTDDEMALLHSYDENLNLSDSDNLADFANYIFTNFPAERTMLDIWDHGGGPMDGAVYDEYTENMISLANIGKAVSAIDPALWADKDKPLDILGFDACLMSSMEVAAMFQDDADYLVASLEVEPGAGWYYTGWLNCFAENGEGGTDAASLGKAIIDTYATSTVGAGDWSGAVSETLALTDLSKMDGLLAAFENMAERLNAIALDVENPSRFAQVTRAAEKAQYTSNRYLIDLYDFTEHIQPYLPVEAEAVLAALGKNPGTTEEDFIGEVGGDGAVIYRGTGAAHNRAIGLSFFYPVLHARFSMDNIENIRAVVELYQSWRISEAYPDYIGYAIARQSEYWAFDPNGMRISAKEGADNYTLMVDDTSAIGDVQFILTQYEETGDASEEYYLGAWSENGLTADYDAGEFTEGTDANWFSLNGETITCDYYASMFGDIIVMLEVPVYVNGDRDVIARAIILRAAMPGEPGIYRVIEIVMPEHDGEPTYTYPVVTGETTVEPLLLGFDSEAVALTNAHKIGAPLLLVESDLDELSGLMTFANLDETVLEDNFGRSPLKSGQNVLYTGYFVVTDLNRDRHISEPCYYVTIGDVNEMTVEDIPDQRYTGEPIEPKVTLTFWDEEYLVEGVDYDVTYENNVSVGTAAAIITGKGEVSGSVTKTFRIVSESFTVTFDGNGGTPETLTKIVTAPKTAVDALPVDPTRNGYNFKGWNTSADGSGTAFTANTAVTGDITVYAQWQGRPGGGGSSGGSSGGTPSYTVFFDSNGGNPVSSQNITGGGKVSKPADPVKDGCAFGGWHTDKTLTNVYDFGAAVKGGFTLYAKWDEKKPDGTVINRIEKPFVSGYADGTFNPEGQITRAEAAQLLYNLYGGDIPTSDYASADMDGHWAIDALRWAAYEGYLQGYGDGAIRPDAPITRGELSAVLYRAARKLNIYGDSGAAHLTALGFAITDMDGHWALKNILYLASKGVVKGYEDGSFKPDKAVTRAEAVAMIARLMGRTNEYSPGKAFTDVPQTHWAYAVIMNAVNGRNETN